MKEREGLFAGRRPFGGPSPCDGRTCPMQNSPSNTCGKRHSHPSNYHQDNDNAKI